MSNYAVSGAACSNSITPRIEPQTQIPYPSVLEYEVPAFLAENRLHKRPSESTVYTIWIGTNDLGYEGFLTDSQARNATVATYVDCVYHALDTVYAEGGRHFVLMNLAPLHLAPLYAVPEHGGTTAEESQYWTSKPENITEVSHRMKDQVVMINQVFAYRTPYELLIARRYPGARFAVMDMYGLVCSHFTVGARMVTPQTNQSHSYPIYTTIPRTIQGSRTSPLLTASVTMKPGSVSVFQTQRNICGLMNCTRQSRQTELLQSSL